MNNKFFYLSILLYLTAGTMQAQYSNLLPVPQSMNIKAGQLRLSGNFTIGINLREKDELLQHSIARFTDQVLKKSNHDLHPRVLKSGNLADSAVLLIQVEKAAGMQIGMNESYTISVNTKRVILHAENTIAAIRGMETFLQLLATDERGYFLQEVEIADSPRFPWRGLMIDVSRHFIPVDVLKRNIEAMAEVKMNVLHLHLSDNEGFRFESKKFPELQGKGSDGKFYLQSELKDLISFAQYRGILIIPEFDMPGHSKSWFAGYPELSSSAGPYKPGAGYAMDPVNPVKPSNLLNFIKTYPTPAMDPSKEATYGFLDAFLSEVCQVFPSPYIHIGVDENNGVVWRNNPSISEFMNEKGMKSTEELQAYFASRIHDILKKHGKKTIAWEEIYSPEISPDVIIQVWDTRAPKTRSVEMLQHGNFEINSRGYYLDLFMPAYVHYLNDPLPYHCPDSLKQRILGGEAAIWTELADEQNIEERIWPRAAAIAERFWSPAAVENVIDMYRRLFEINKSLAQQGLQHIAIYNSRLHQLAGADNFEGLKTLVDVLSPVKGYKRVMALFFRPVSKYESGSLDSIADIAWVDPEVRRKFRMKVASYLSKPSAKKEKDIRDLLYSWSKNQGKIDSLLKSNPKLNCLIHHSGNLAEIARIGIKALDYLHLNTRPPVTWTSEKLAVLKSASQAKAEVELSIVPEIEALVNQKLSPEQKGFPIF